MQDTNKHSRKYSPSKSSTWLNCALSTLLNDGSNQESNPQAEFGTQCHELGAALICKSLKITDYDHEQKSIDEVIKGLSLYSEEMYDIASGYADFVINTYEFEKKRSETEPLIVVEQQLDMDFADDAKGTLDCGIISSVNGGTLTVIDLKTGRLKVQAYDNENASFNSQLGIYALYFYKAYKDLYPIKNIRLVIYQPVISNTNEYEMPIEKLLEFEKKVLLPAVAKTKVENPEAHSGPYCKYCAGKAICAERMKANMNVANEVSQRKNTLTDDEIAEILPKMDELIAFAQDIKDFALKRALNGYKWKGLKLVRGKATRKIGNEEAVIKICEEKGIDAYSAKKLAGITELTKRFGKKEFNEFIGPYIVIQEAQPALVSESDPREEMIVNKEDK